MSMMIRVLMACVLTTGTGWAQSLAVGDQQGLGRGWAALAAGRTDEAVSVASDILKRKPRSHAAISLKIEALSSGAQPIVALTAYEEWLLNAGRNVEDRGLLEPIAVATLVTLALSNDLGLAGESLTRLAKYDPDAATLVIERLGAAGSFDGARVVLGDASAAARLTGALTSPSPQVKLRAIRQLAAAKGLDLAPVAALLSDGAPPVRAAAVEALAANDGSSAIPRLQPLLKDPDPFVRATTAVALGRLRDPESVKLLDQMAQSPVGDTAAMAAVVLKEQGADVSGIAQRLLADENPLTRLSAVALLRDTDGPQAEALLQQAARDPNPVIRSRAAELMAATSIEDPALLRRLLRDDSGEVRSLAAVSLLHFALGR
jgi:HEAT repeat protein